ncbi:MAG TPA: type VI secretion system baseplate subunit TssF [Paracoccus sp. (in: a-proteobacteria)]|nr:type VI secretion system baseplate subunit TssF [Paracoccus sp. (in: a-proteobacteria)]
MLIAAAILAGALPLAGAHGVAPERALTDARAVAAVSSRPVIERLALPGPLAFGRGTEITLEIDETLLAGASHLLLPALLDRLFARHASINAFVRTRTRLVRRQEEMSWPMRPGLRARI